MHDIDRTLMEYETEADLSYENEWEYGPGEEFEDEWEYDPEFEVENETEYDPAYAAEFEFNEFESLFDEAEEMELAAELLAVSSEAELDQFMGSLFRKVIPKLAQSVRKIPFKRIGRRLFKHFRPLLRKTVPLLGRAAGSYLGGPLGGQIGSMAASRLGRRFGLELEGLSPEDQEFEVSRGVVRLLGNAVVTAAKAPPTADPDAVAKSAIKRAIHTSAPGMQIPKSKRVSTTPCGAPPAQSGRWFRSKRGKIVLVGV